MENERPNTGNHPYTVAVSSTFAAAPLAQPLAFWLAKLGLEGRVAFAPYNQPFQELLDPSSLLSANAGGFNLLLIRLEDWAGHALEQTIAEFVGALAAAAARSSVPHLVISCPPSLRATADPNTSDALAAADDRLARDVTGISGVELVRAVSLLRLCGGHVCDDSYGDRIAHIPYTPQFFTVLSSVVARRLHGLRSPRYKVLVIDCDDALWTGRCGDDGPEGVVIDRERAAVQEFLLELHDKGILLCLASRNARDDVFAVFQQRAEMRLTADHVVAFALNWDPASEKVRALASELRLGTDSFVFMSADPVDRAEVQANCPQALAIQLPARADAVPDFLRNLWIFDGPAATGESRRRTALYQEEAARSRAAEDAPTLAAFIEGLGVEVSVSPLAPDRLQRASELTLRTNQFNATTLRQSPAELETLAANGAMCFSVSASDRFGDYGVVGLTIARATDDVLRVDGFVLSCRAMGRGVEHQMLAALGRTASERGLGAVEMSFVPSARNQPAGDFMRGIAGGSEEVSELGSRFRIKTSAAVEARYRPETSAAHKRQHLASRHDTMAPAREPGSPGHAPSDATGAHTRAQADLLTSIATDLRDLDRLHAAVTGRTKPRPDVSTRLVPPRTPIEQRVTGIIAEVLQLQQVGIDDDFIELGGDSLGAMRILSRVRRTFQVELPTALFYSGEFTAAALAEQIEHAQRTVARTAP